MTSGINTSALPAELPSQSEFHIITNRQTNQKTNTQDEMLSIFTNRQTTQTNRQGF